MLAEPNHKLGAPGCIQCENVILLIDTLRMYSFDVFDTLITRKTGTPKGIFAVVQDRLHRQFPKSSVGREFYRLRINAEIMARSNSSAEDVTYDEIYACLADQVDDAKLVVASKKLELDVELEFIIGVEKNIELVRSLLKRNQRVVLISDMYLPALEIKKLIAKCAPDIAESCRLYVSSELRMTKATGALFNWVAEQEGINLSELNHFGDNIHSDVAVPNELGVAATHDRCTQLKSWERIGESENCVVWQQISGAARNYRLQELSFQRNFGYSIVGPMLGGYVCWLVRKVEKYQLEKLYFLARDGFLLQKMFELLQSPGSLIQTEYLYCSRLSLQKAMLSQFDQTGKSYALFTFARNTLEGVAARLGISSNQIKKLLPGVPERQKLTVKQIRYLANKLDDGEVAKQIERRGDINRRLTLDYLKQKGILDARQIAIVDLGWNGSMQRCLNSLVSSVNADANIVGFYFGLTSKRIELNSEQEMAYSYEFETLSKNEFCHDAKFFEILASATHGSTTGYRENVGRAQPELDSQGESIRDWGYDDAIAGALDFVRENRDLLLDTADNPKWCQFGQEYLSYLNRGDVDPEFASKIGEYPFSPDSDDQAMTKLGPPLSLGQVAKYLLSGPQKRAELTLWANGSAVRSSFLARLILGSGFSKILRYCRRPWMLYEIMPRPLLQTLLKCIPKPLIRYVQMKTLVK